MVARLHDLIGAAFRWLLLGALGALGHGMRFDLSARAGVGRFCGLSLHHRALAITSISSSGATRSFRCRCPCVPTV
jgi:hypothetical protein